MSLSLQLKGAAKLAIPLQHFIARAVRGIYVLARKPQPTLQLSQSFAVVMSTPSPAADSISGIAKRFFPSATPQPSQSGADTSELSHAIFPGTTYTDNEKVEISQWITSSSRLAALDEDEAKHDERLGSLNTHLSTRTTLLGSKPSLADVAVYARLAPLVAKWTSEERTGEQGYHNIVRYVDFIQNAPLFGLSLDERDKINIDANDVRFVHKPLDPKEEKERKKKEKALAAGGGASKGESKPALVVGQGKPEGAQSKKEVALEAVSEAKDKVKGAVTGESPAQSKKGKKEKAAKPAKQPAKETPLSPSLLDLRVGHILKAVNHPNADSLYVSTIACGDPAGTENTSEYEGQVVRTVCSGLNGLVPLAEMQNRKIVAVCNLKPVKMRGVLSAAMVLAASPRLAEGEEDKHAGPVELVSPPVSATAGERIYFEGWEGEPEGVLNPKKKVWEMIQPGFTTTDDLGVAFEMSRVEQLAGEKASGRPAIGKLVAKSGGGCKVMSLKGAAVR